MGKTNPSEETVEEEDVESDDSSEEEAEEDTEDSESESEDDESSDEESEKEEESESAEPVGKFLDIAKLPKELLPLGKKMQASFTKKMQGLKKDFDDRQTELSQKYSHAIRSEKALSVLSENDSFKLFLADARENRPYGYSSVFNKGSSKKEEESSSEGNGAGNITEESLVKIIDKVVSQRIEPFFKSHANMTQAQIKKNLPNFSKYEVEVEELMQSEGISLERAYQIASEKDRIAAAIAGAIKTGKKDIKRIPRTEGGKGSAGSSELKMKPAKSLKEALNYAASQMGD